MDTTTPVVRSSRSICERIRSHVLYRHNVDEEEEEDVETKSSLPAGAGNPVASSTRSCFQELLREVQEDGNTRLELARDGNALVEVAKECKSSLAYTRLQKIVITAFLTESRALAASERRRHLRVGVGGEAVEAARRLSWWNRGESLPEISSVSSFSSDEPIHNSCCGGSKEASTSGSRSKLKKRCKKKEKKSIATHPHHYTSRRSVRAILRPTSYRIPTTTSDLTRIFCRIILVGLFRSRIPSYQRLGHQGRLSLFAQSCHWIDEGVSADINSFLNVSEKKPGNNTNRLRFVRLVAVRTTIRTFLRLSVSPNCGYHHRSFRAKRRLDCHPNHTVQIALLAHLYAQSLHRTATFTGKIATFAGNGAANAVVNGATDVAVKDRVTDSPAATFSFPSTIDNNDADTDAIPDTKNENKEDGDGTSPTARRKGISIISGLKANLNQPRTPNASYRKSILDTVQVSLSSLTHTTTDATDASEESHYFHTENNEEKVDEKVDNENDAASSATATSLISSLSFMSLPPIGGYRTRRQASYSVIGGGRGVDGGGGDGLGFGGGGVESLSALRRMLVEQYADLLFGIPSLLSESSQLEPVSPPPISKLSFSLTDHDGESEVEKKEEKKNVGGRFKRLWESKFRSFHNNEHCSNGRITLAMPQYGESVVGGNDGFSDASTIDSLLHLSQSILVENLRSEELEGTVLRSWMDTTLELSASWRCSLVSCSCSSSSSSSSSMSSFSDDDHEEDDENHKYHDEDHYEEEGMGIAIRAMNNLETFICMVGQCQTRTDRLAPYLIKKSQNSHLPNSSSDEGGSSSSIPSPKEGIYLLNIIMDQILIVTALSSSTEPNSSSLIAETTDLNHRYRESCSRVLVALVVACPFGNEGPEYGIEEGDGDGVTGYLLPVVKTILRELQDATTTTIPDDDTTTNNSHESDDGTDDDDSDKAIVHQKYTNDECTDDDNDDNNDGSCSSGGEKDNALNRNNHDSVETTTTTDNNCNKHNLNPVSIEKPPTTTTSLDDNNDYQHHDNKHCSNKSLHLKSSTNPLINFLCRTLAQIADAILLLPSPPQTPPTTITTTTTTTVEPMTKTEEKLQHLRHDDDGDNEGHYYSNDKCDDLLWTIGKDVISVLDEIEGRLSSELAISTKPTSSLTSPSSHNSSNTQFPIVVLADAKGGWRTVLDKVRVKLQRRSTMNMSGIGVVVSKNKNEAGGMWCTKGIGTDPSYSTLWNSGGQSALIAATRLDGDNNDDNDDDDTDKAANPRVEVQQQQQQQKQHNSMSQILQEPTILDGADLSESSENLGTLWNYSLEHNVIDNSSDYKSRESQRQRRAKSPTLAELESYGGEEAVTSQAAAVSSCNETSSTLIDNQIGDGIVHSDIISKTVRYDSLTEHLKRREDGEADDVGSEHKPLVTAAHITPSDDNLDCIRRSDAHQDEECGALLDGDDSSGRKNDARKDSEYQHNNSSNTRDHPRRNENAISSAIPVLINNKSWNMKYVLLSIIVVVAIVVLTSVLLTKPSSPPASPPPPSPPPPPSSPTLIPSSQTASQVALPTSYIVGRMASYIQTSYGVDIELLLEDENDGIYSKAFKWITEDALAVSWMDEKIVNDDDIFSFAVDPLLRFNQRFCVALFYFKMGGDKMWTNCSHTSNHDHCTVFDRDYVEMKNRRLWLSQSHECEWGGIICLDDGSNFTSGIHLNDMNLHGSIPTEIQKLTELRELCLMNNFISGYIPTEIGSLSKLIAIDLRSNFLSNTIPFELYSLTNLVDITLGYNNLNGTITSNIGNLALLKVLHVAGNEISGSIPSEIGLVDLHVFMMNENNFSGSLPNEFNLLTNLHTIFIDNNNFAGELQLPITSKLTVLPINNNRFNSTLPDNFYLLTNLHYFDANNNEFSGELKPAISNLSHLQVMTLLGNGFEGNIPEEIGKLTNLETLQVHGNNFKGMIPDAICELNIASFSTDCRVGQDGTAEVICKCCTMCCDPIGICSYLEN